MKHLAVFLSVLMLGMMGLSAQNFAGSYKLEYKGRQVSSNATKTVKQVTGLSTLEITQNGNDITVTMGDSGQGLWSANRMSGQAGSRHFVGVLVNGSKSVYTITANLVNGQLQGTYSYLRYGNPSTGIVPGWTRVKFTAKK